MKKITLADIAKKTGYSVNTVSHALRDMKDISEGVKSYINDTAKGMGYIPNIAAGTLRNGKTKSIALIISDITTPQYSLLAKELELSLKKNGYSLIIINTLSDKELERSGIISAISKNVDGIILSADISAEEMSLIKESSIPYLFLNSEADFSVSENFQESGYLLGSYIASLGHRKALFLSDSKKASGLKKAFDEVSGKVITDNSPIQKALDRNADCSCVICEDSYMALSVYNILHKSGRNIPEDISIAVLEYKEAESPFSFTSAGASAKEISEALAQTIFKLMDKEETSSQITLPSYLTEGETVKEPARRFVARKALSDYLL